MATMLKKIATALGGKTKAKTRIATKCIICGSGNVRVETITAVGKATANFPSTPKQKFRFCEDCGHCGIPENTGGYETAEKFADGSKPSATKSARVGDGVRPGREYHIFNNAFQILQRNGLSVLVYGAGLSPDYKLIAQHPAVSSVKVTDVDDFMKTPAFIPLDAEGVKFDIVIACEVVEHFLDPIRDFSGLFKFMKDDGMVICSTNIHNGGEISKLKYPFIKGHVSYYSGGAIEVIAKKFGLDFDFRLPSIAQTRGGPKKRYIFFFNNGGIQRKISLFFAKNPYALSE
jgi:SAM-dependent methyltransferase/predicted nucleic-acid-binding Zn-ribbon protein